MRYPEPPVRSLIEFLRRPPNISPEDLAKEVLMYEENLCLREWTLKSNDAFNIFSVFGDDLPGRDILPIERERVRQEKTLQLAAERSLYERLKRGYEEQAGVKLPVFTPSSLPDREGIR